MSRKNKVKIFKIVLMLLVIISCIALIMYLAPVMKNLSTLEGQIKFKDKVNELGIAGILLLFGLQVAQVFLIVLPGEPMEILAGMCYGWFGGLIFITISVAIITALIFYLVRKAGKKFVYNFWDEEKIKKIENNKIFQNPRKIEIIMVILFMLPGTPKDLLVYIAGLLPLKPIRFILISTFARFPSVISSTIVGANFAKGDWKMSLLAYALTIIFVGILFIIINKLDKENITQKAIKSMQEK